MSVVRTVLILAICAFTTTTAELGFAVNDIVLPPTEKDVFIEIMDVRVRDQQWTVTAHHIDEHGKTVTWERNDHGSSVVLEATSAQYQVELEATNGDESYVRPLVIEVSPFPEPAP